MSGFWWRQLWSASDFEMTELRSHHRRKVAVACIHTQTHTPIHLIRCSPLQPPPFPPPLLLCHGLWSGLHCPESHAAAVSHDSASPHSYFSSILFSMTWQFLSEPTVWLALCILCPSSYWRLIGAHHINISQPGSFCQHGFGFDLSAKEMHQLFVLESEFEVLYSKRSKKTSITHSIMIKIAYAIKIVLVSSFIGLNDEMKRCERCTFIISELFQWKLIHLIRDFVTDSTEMGFLSVLCLVI